MNVLEKIVEDKKLELEERKSIFPLFTFEASLTPSTKSMSLAISNDKKAHGSGYILEVKQASPSKGMIREDFDLEMICSAYKDYASVVSVLTDNKYFSGDFERITRVRELLSQPILCKDFFIDTYQVKLARFYGADAILLMLSVLDDQQYRELAEVANAYGMDILTEVSNAEEMQRAVNLKAKIIGINNRNLRDLTTDLKQTIRLTDELKTLVSDNQLSETLIISESGVYLHQQTKALANVCDGFLVGSSLMAQTDIAQACRDLIVGQHKVCGLTRLEDVNTVYQAGARFHGAILVEASKRAVDLTSLFELTINDAYPPLANLVIVTKDFAIDDLNVVIERFAPAAIQLHGTESEDYVLRLKELIKNKSFNTKIWKVIHCAPNSTAADVIKACEAYMKIVDGFVFDTANFDGASGGTGKVFNWEMFNSPDYIDYVLNSRSLPVLLAGGLGPDNVNIAKSLPVNGLDFNSKLEIAPGVKSADLINNTFSLINTRISQKDNHE